MRTKKHSKKKAKNGDVEIGRPASRQANINLLELILEKGVSHWAIFSGLSFIRE